MCPFCSDQTLQIKKGFFVRDSDHERLQRFRCKACKRQYSDATHDINYRYRLRDISQGVYFSLCSGLSQKRCALQFSTKPETVVRRFVRFGAISRQNLTFYRSSRPKVERIQFDEMESCVHTKKAPLTIPIAVEENTRKILALRVGDIAAKGTLARVAKEQGAPKRKCERRKCLEGLMEDLKACAAPRLVFKSDKSRHYPSQVKKHFPQAIHRAFKGRRERENGLGELKTGGFDPIFSLNHTFAMIRDNVKRMARKTWATTKKKERLELHLYLYAWFHNLWLDQKDKPVQLVRLNGCN